MFTEIPVQETEVIDLLTWAEEHAGSGTTNHPDATYEQGVYDALAWAMGETTIRPDQE